MIDFGRFFEVFWSCFFVIVKKLRDVHFIVSVCSFACFLLGVGVRVSCACLDEGFVLNGFLQTFSMIRCVR